MMTKYFVTLIYMKQDGTYDRSTAMYDSFDDAEFGFHQAFTTAIPKQEYKKAIVFMYNDDGDMKFKRVWERGVVA